MEPSPHFPLHDRLGLLLARRGAVAEARLREALGVAGLSMRSTVTLMHLGGGPVNQQALIDLLGVDPSALVSVLNDLESLGLAERQRDAADRRRHIVTITADGCASLRKLEAVLDEADGHLFAGLSAQERVQLRDLLGKVSAADEVCGE